jgi:2-aminoethylphosphonate-pyruvate transaminase
MQFQNSRRLFTPGPLTTSRTVKEAMLVDMGSRDDEFIAIVRDIRRQLLALGGVSQAQGYEAVLMQGSGTFGIEAVLSSSSGRAPASR